MFKIGDEVVCIDASIKPELAVNVKRDFKHWITKGEKYIIREILENEEIVVGVLLEGVTNDPIFIPLINRVQEPAFALWRFRKGAENALEKGEEMAEELLNEIGINEPIKIESPDEL